MVGRRLGTRSIAERDRDRLSSGAKRAKDFNLALDHIVQVIQEEASLVSFPIFRRFFETGYGERNNDYFGPETLERVLGRLHITENQWTDIEALTQNWASLYDNPEIDSWVQPLLTNFAKFIGSEIPTYHSQFGGLSAVRLAFPDIHLHFFDEDVYLVLVPDSRAGPNEFAQVKDIIREYNATMRVTLLLVLGNGDTLRELAKASSMEIVVLDEDDCREIVLSSDSRRTFCHCVSRRVSVQAIQPYQTQGKVRDRMFYGRQDEIKRLKSNLTSSFAIYGGRLIGKSSLLEKIAQEFQNDSGSKYQVCSITAQGLDLAIDRPVEICRDILKRLSIPTATHRSIGTFERLMRDYLEAHSGCVLILIDEIDELIAFDQENNDKMLQSFHNLNSDYGERCRFVFAGYRELAHECMDSQSRFRNFAEQIRLGNLDPINARKLIEEPMCNELGFTLESDDLVDRILELTAGHPNYIQVFCKELTEYLEHQQRRRIRQEDIEHTFHNPDFQARVVETFYVNFSPLQRIITLLVILEDQLEFSLPEVMDLLDSYGLSLGVPEVYQELRQLEMSFVIEKMETRYRFVHKMFPEILKASEDLNDFAIRVLVTLGAWKQ